MSNCLVVRLAGPLQAWPALARFDSRPSRPVPTWSALVGLIHAALGLSRPLLGEPMTVHPGIAQASVVVRVDRPGLPVTDFQTVNPLSKRVFDELEPSASDRAQVRQMSGDQWRTPKSDLPSITTLRGHLADACFMLFIEPADEYFDVIAGALERPRFAWYLGRKSCPPSYPCFLGAVEEGIGFATRQLPVVDPSANGGHVGVDVHYLQGMPQGNGLRITEMDEPTGRVGSGYALRERVVEQISVSACASVTQQVEWCQEHGL